MAKRSGDLVRTIVELLETESEVAAEARKARRDAEAASTVKETVNNPEV
jgi:hypothetical protein